MGRQPRLSGLPRLVQTSSQASADGGSSFFDLRRAVRAGVQRTGLTLTDEQLEEKIQGIVKQMMVAETTRPIVEPASARQETCNPAQDTSQYTEEEKTGSSQGVDQSG